MKVKRYAEEEKQKLVSDFQNLKKEGFTNAQACEKLNVPLPTIYKWITPKYQKRAKVSKRRPVVETLVVPDTHLPTKQDHKTILVVGYPSEIAQVIREAGL